MPMKPAVDPTLSGESSTRMSPPRRRLGAVSARDTVGPQCTVAPGCWIVVISLLGWVPAR